MASTLKHFADPHLLLKRQYKSSATHIVCDICRSSMAGLTGYHCIDCDFDIHEVCAGYFKETVSSFAHPWHTLTLCRIPSSTSVRWTCDLCTEEFPPGSLVYRCVRCMFDVHPLCTMLPQTIHCPADPAHDLCMAPAGQRDCCSACNRGLDVWQYRCGSCRLKLHIACASGVPVGGERGDAAAVITHQTTGSAQSNTVNRPRRRTVVAKFLLKTTFRIMIDTATGGMASPVLDVLEAAWH
ncbi:hypothetical protein BS78_02G347000 [Paspalum vaginatum]|nr:hypothetical protein BS78_02G347000 [Paspalum vaginatum]